MITIVSYGLGNVQAFAQAYKRMGIATREATNSTELRAADRIILPGVGAFDWAMERLERSGMRPELDRLVLENKVPVLGVCVGMQMMAKRSAEGQRPGLSWIDATVERLPERPQQGARLPHMGWNDVVPSATECLFKGMDAMPRFYFLHSYYVETRQASDVLAQAEYGRRFTCAVRSGNVWGVQFHPEKSHHWGTALLRNFAEAS